MVSIASEAGRARQPAQDVADLHWIVYAMFFTIGCITSLNDVIVPKLKALFVLPYVEMMLVPAAFFGAFLCVALPAAFLLRRVGYLRTAVIGLLTVGAGCLLFIPASVSGRFPLFLIAIFVMASGITIVQVMINPLASMLGDPATTNSRLSFSQAFYSLGTTVAPYVGAGLILGGAARADALQSRVIAQVYVGVAIVVLILAAVVWTRRHRLAEPRLGIEPLSRAFRLLKRPVFAYGVACVFVYVGAEITVGSIVVNYLMQPAVMGLGPQAAGRHLPFYWGGAMLGRFLGGIVLRRFAQGSVLIGVAGAAMMMLLLSARLTGELSGWSLLAVGLCNSVMFPTIFSLACRGLGEHAAEGSGIIVLASVGGGIVPVLTGFCADHVGLKAALLIPACCYAVVVSFGLFVRRRPSA